MTTTTNIHKAETITSSATRFSHQKRPTPYRLRRYRPARRNRERAQANRRASFGRRHGLNLKELADRMGVNYGYLSSVASGRRPWTPLLRERATAVLGEVPGQGVVYRQGGLVKGESTYTGSAPASWA